MRHPLRDGRLHHCGNPLQVLDGRTLPCAACCEAPRWYTWRPRPQPPTEGPRLLTDKWHKRHLRAQVLWSSHE